MGSSSNQPQEIEDGEAGFALLFPKIDGVKIQTFHFPKEVKNRVIDENKFAEAGMSCVLPSVWAFVKGFAALWGSSVKLHVGPAAPGPCLQSMGCSGFHPSLFHPFSGVFEVVILSLSQASSFVLQAELWRGSC